MIHALLMLVATMSAPVAGGVAAPTDVDPFTGAVVCSVHGDGTSAGSHEVDTARDATGRARSIKAAGDSWDSVDQTITGADGAGTVDTFTDGVLGYTATYQYADARDRPTNYTRTGTSGTDTKTWSYAQPATGAGEAVTFNETPSAGWTPTTKVTTTDPAGRTVLVQDYNQPGGYVSHSFSTTGPDGNGAQTVTDTLGGPGTTNPVVTATVYGIDGNPRTVTTADGTVVTITTDVNGNTTAVDNALPGQVQTFTLDSESRVTSIDTNGFTEKRDYSQPGGVVVITSPQGDQTTLTRNSAGQTLNSSTPYGSATQVVATTYDGDWPAQRITMDGTTTLTETMTYDDTGRPLDNKKVWNSATGSVTHEEATSPSSASGVLTLSTVTTDTENNSGGTSSDGTTTLVKEDSFGHPASRMESGTGINEGGGSGTGTAGTAGVPGRQQLDVSGAADLEDDTYDQDGRLISRKVDNVETDYQYDYSGRLILITTGSETTTLAYDDRGFLNCRTDPDGRTAVYAYDTLGRKTSEAYGLGVGTCPSGGYATNTVPATATTGPLGYRVTSYTYNMNDTKPLTVTYGTNSGAAATWTYAYGPRGELTSTTLPSGVGGTFTYTYDMDNRLAGITPPNGVQTQTFTYDALNHMTQRTRSGGQFYSTWNTAWTGGLATEMDPAGLTTATQYDSFGRVSSRVFSAPSGAVVGSATDAASKPHPSVSMQSYLYGARGELAQATEKYTDSNVLTTQYGFDGQGRPLNRTRNSVPADTLTYGYTGTYAASGPQLQTQPTSVIVSHSDGTGSTTNYSYDSFDRVASVSNLNQTDTTTVTWAAGGARVLNTNSSTLNEQHCYDGVGDTQLIVSGSAAGNYCNTVAPNCSGAPSISLPADGKAEQQFAYCYDARENRTAELYWTANGAETTLYGYDAADRLTGYINPDLSAAFYRLSGTGARMEQKSIANYLLGTAGAAFSTVNVGAADFDFGFNVDPADRLYDGADGSAHTAIYNMADGSHAGSVQIDSAGRTTQVVYAAPSFLSQTRTSNQYQYDLAGRMFTATSGTYAYGTVPTFTADGPATVYGYDDMGHLNAEYGAGNPIYSTYSMGGLVEQRQGTTSAGVSQYERFGNMVVSIAGQRAMHDSMGSITGLVNGSTNTFNRFDPWGGFHSPSTPPTGPPQAGAFGATWVASAGMNHLWHRNEIPDLGIFNTEDPIGATDARLMAPNGLHGWGYANGNPGKYLDPTGEYTDCKRTADGQNCVLSPGDSLQTVSFQSNVSPQRIMNHNSGISWESGKTLFIPDAYARDSLYREEMTNASNTYRLAVIASRGDLSSPKVAEALRDIAAVDADFISQGVEDDFRNGVVLPLVLQAGLGVILGPAAASNSVITRVLAGLTIAHGALGVGEAAVGETISLNGETKSLKGSDRAWHLVGAVSEIALGSSVLVKLKTVDVGSPTSPSQAAAEAPLAGVFKGHSSGQGFSGAYDTESGLVNLRPSTAERPTPEGFVPRRGGHGPVSAELGGNKADHRGFTAFLQSDGTLRVQWYSGTLNSDFPGGFVPVVERPAIVNAIESQTGRTVSDQ